MKNSLYGLLLALQFLTRLPVPVSCPWTKQTSRWAIRAYPLVGMVLGTVIVLVFKMVEGHMPLFFLSLLVLTLWVWLTGGLHLDGWMDVADAVGSNAPIEKKWEIMKDPHVGSFGIIALLFLMVWKIMFIYMILEDPRQLIFSFLLILALSRFGAVVLMYTLPPAKKSGLAWEWRRNINGWDVVWSAIPVAAAFLFLHEFLFLLPSYLLFIVVFGWWVKKAFKGINGDLLGTAIEGGELWGLAITWIYFSFAMG
ncbi:adenosylcobinamide-GDP ribazoletransferase [Sutcliffiella halmapala]